MTSYSVCSITTWLLVPSNFMSLPVVIPAKLDTFWPSWMPTGRCLCFKNEQAGFSIELVPVLVIRTVRRAMTSGLRITQRPLFRVSVLVYIACSKRWSHCSFWLILEVIAKFKGIASCTCFQGFWLDCLAVWVLLLKVSEALALLDDFNTLLNEAQWTEVVMPTHTAF